MTIGTTAAIFNAEKLRQIRDYNPTFSNRPPGIDLGDMLNDWAALVYADVASFSAGVLPTGLDFSTNLTGTAAILLNDNVANALDVKQGANSYLKFVTTNSGELVVVGKTLQLLAGIDFSANATGVSVLALADNLASAFVISEAGTAYLTFVSTNGAEAINSAKRLTTTDGVASGTARIVGGLESAIVAASAGAGASSTAEVDFSVTRSLPANMLKAGSVLRIHGCAVASATHTTDTFTFRVYIGAQALLVSAAIDLADGDAFVFDIEIVARAAPGASAALCWSSNGVNKTTACCAGGVANFATNGALVIKASVQCSASDAGNIAALQQLDVWITG